MSDRMSSADTHHQQDAADSGHFAPLASAKYMQLTTFTRDGRPVPARVHGVTDGDRAYFGAWSRSGSVKRLSHTDAVQVTPCSALGLCYGPPLDATARLLPAEKARRAAGKLARKYPVRRRFLIPLPHRTWRRKMAHYELLADDAAGGQDVGPQDLPAPDQHGDQSGNARHDRQEFIRCQVVRTDVTDYGPASIASIWSAPARVMHGAVLFGGQLEHRSIEKKLS